MQHAACIMQHATCTIVHVRQTEWGRGTVVKKLHYEQSFPPGCVAAYQIQLGDDNDNELTYIPIDDDDLVRCAPT